MKVVYAPAYEINIGPHVWPTGKYRRIHERLASREAFSCVAPEAATWEQVALAHFPAWVDRLRHGTLTPDETARLEIPWNAEIAAGFLLMAGGTLLAARAALDDGIAMHLGGGLHHAFPGHGEGFCPINDIAIAIRVLQVETRIQRAAVIDCDVHQGNGTAVCFARDARVYTFSIHQEQNYPVWKPPGNLDIGLRDRTGDEEYLEHLREGIEAVLHHRPQLVIYAAGADPYKDDQLGGLALTKEGLRLRDRAVLKALRAAEIPVAIVLAGGYARRVEDTVDIHVATAEEAIGTSRPGRPSGSS